MIFMMVFGMTQPGHEPMTYFILCNEKPISSVLKLTQRGRSNVFEITLPKKLQSNCPMKCKDIVIMTLRCAKMKFLDMQQST